jgi:glycine oxidase
MVYVAMSKSEERVLRRRFRWQKKLGMSVRWVSRSRLLKSQPGLSPRSLSGLFYPGISKLNPKKLRQALMKLARQLHVTFHWIPKNVSLILEKNRVLGVRAGAKVYFSPVVVNAAGSWTGKVLFSKIRLPIVPVRGQILILKGKLKISTIVHSLDGAYVVPWDQGQYLLGSTLEFVGFKPQVTAKGLRDILRRVEKLVPSADSLKCTTSWAGLRPFTRDVSPVIGPAPLKGYYFATGYYRSGILIGPYVGELLAKGILSGQMASVLAPFRPDRFQNRVQGIQ